MYKISNLIYSIYYQLLRYYVNEETGWVIRFWRKRWMFDWRGLNNDDTAGAVAEIEDARHPGLVHKAWKVTYIKDNKVFT